MTIHSSHTTWTIIAIRISKSKSQVNEHIIFNLDNAKFKTEETNESSNNLFLKAQRKTSQSYPHTSSQSITRNSKTRSQITGIHARCKRTNHQDPQLEIPFAIAPIASCQLSCFLFSLLPPMYCTGRICFQEP